MHSNRSIPESTVIPELGYHDVPAAAKWLCQAFGFRQRLRIADHRIQLSVGQGAVVVKTLPNQTGPIESAHSVMVRVENIDDHCAKAASAGAHILHPPQNYPYGERQYTAKDLAGHIWTFSQTIEDKDPASWGGVLSESADD